MAKLRSIKRRGDDKFPNSADLGLNFRCNHNLGKISGPLKPSPRLTKLSSLPVERLISRAGQNTYSCLQSDRSTRDAINYPTRGQANPRRLILRRAWKKGKERERERKRAEAHLAEKWCPDERWFAGDPCGSSLREENRCSTDSSAIPLSSLARNPTLLGPTTPSPSFSHQPCLKYTETRTELVAATSSSGSKQKVTAPYT